MIGLNVELYAHLGNIQEKIAYFIYLLQKNYLGKRMVKQGKEGISTHKYIFAPIETGIVLEPKNIK